MDTFDIFLSYNSADKDLAVRIAESVCVQWREAGG